VTVCIAKHCCSQTNSISEIQSTTTPILLRDMCSKSLFSVGVQVTVIEGEEVYEHTL